MAEAVGAGGLVGVEGGLEEGLGIGRGWGLLVLDYLLEG